MPASSFVLNYLAGKAGMTPEALTPCASSQDSAATVEGCRGFVFLLSLKQFGGPHEILLRCPHCFGGGTKYTRFLAALAGALLLLSSPASLRAQALSGITGTVTDQSGAVVPDAKVTVANTARVS